MADATNRLYAHAVGNADLYAEPRYDGLHPLAVEALGPSRLAVARSRAMRAPSRGLPRELIELGGDGVDLMRASPQEIVDRAWQSSPTDGIGEMIDDLVRRGLVHAPWDAEEIPAAPAYPQQRRR